jgi:hypothetical protein
MAEVVKRVIKVVAGHDPEEALQPIRTNPVVVDKPKLIVDSHEVINQVMSRAPKYVEVSVK